MYFSTIKKKKLGKQKFPKDGKYRSSYLERAIRKGKYGSGDIALRVCEVRTETECN